MPLSVGKDEKQDEFISRCATEMTDSHPDWDNDRVVAACFSMWKEGKSAAAPKRRQMDCTPNNGESEDDFMSRCSAKMTANGMSDDDAEEACETAWENANPEKSVGSVIHKTHSEASRGDMEFILSDATIDRYGDSISPEGWDLVNFTKNPIALWNHRSDFPVGTWEQLRVQKNALRGHLRLAPEGISDRIDEIRKLVEHGIIKAVSVGFRDIQSEPIMQKTAAGHVPTGNRYLRSELVECSLVSVPANPQSLSVAKSLKVSDDTLKLVFAGYGNKEDKIIRRDGGTTPGEHAVEKSLKQKEATMSPIAKRIEDAQARIVKLKDQLSEHIKTIDEENPTEEQTAISDELSQKIEQAEKGREMLIKAEKQLMTSTAPAPEPKLETKAAGDLVISGNRPFAVPKKQVKAVDHLFRAAVVQTKWFGQRNKGTSMIDVLKDTYGEDEATHAMLGVVTRAATVPAITTLAGWAKDLVTVAIGEFFDLLLPQSVFGPLSAMGGRFEFGSNGVVTMPTRTAATDLAGAWVAESGAIPVKQGTFSSISLTPKKLGCISSFSREITEHSTPAIEALIRQAIIDDTAIAIDTKLLSADVATASAPSGLRDPAVGTIASAVSVDTTIVGVLADVRTITDNLMTTTNGNVRAPVWLMSPATKLALNLVQAAAGGSFPFRDEVAAGRFQGWPIIVSQSVGDFLYLVDAADFVVASGAPRFDVSDQAVLHFENASPADIGTGGAIAGGLTKSLFQTDSLAVRMLLDLTWGFRRANLSRWITPVAWN